MSKRPYCEKHCGNRQCERDGCTKCAQGATRFCIAHGGGRRCTFPGCDKGARDKFFCAAHGGGKRCKHPGGCGKSAVGGSNFCTAHGGGRRCAVAGCDKSAQSGTKFCVKHGGGKKCQFKGCEKVARGRTLFCAAVSVFAIVLILLSSNSHPDTTRLSMAVACAASSRVAIVLRSERNSCVERTEVDALGPRQGNSLLLLKGVYYYIISLIFFRSCHMCWSSLNLLWRVRVHIPGLFLKRMRQYCQLSIYELHAGCWIAKSLIVLFQHTSPCYYISHCAFHPFPVREMHIELSNVLV